MILIFWTFSSLLYQYIFCHFFKKYDKVSTIINIINPVINIFNGIYTLNIYENKIGLLIGFGGENINDIYSYISILLYIPGSIFILIQKFTTSILEVYYKNINSIFRNEENIEEFIKDSYYNKNKIEKLLREMVEFFNNKLPSVGHILNENRELVIIIVILFLLIVIYAFILCLIEKRKIKQIQTSSIYSQEERAKLDKKLNDGPNDVYNEYKRVKNTLNYSECNKFENINGNINENIKNRDIEEKVTDRVDCRNTENDNIALKIFELNKDYGLSIKKRRKYKKMVKKATLNCNKCENLINKNYKKNSLDSVKKLDDRIYYNMKKNKYINRIVDDTTYGVNNGECLGILGPNGAGKTTSISMITGILSHTHGRVVYGDKDLNETELADLSLGYCSQIDALWKVLTVKETIEFYLDICGYPKKDIPRYIKTLVETCGLENHVDKKVKELSGGTRRKLSLIIAICSSPKYLILDEPSVGLDPFTRRYMWKIITELKKSRNSSIILTTHSTEEAEALCERIAILIEGRLVFIDTPESIKMNYSHNYILEVSTNFPDKFEEFVNKNNLFGLGEDEKYQLETLTHYQKYFVEMKTSNISNVFSLLEKAKEKFIIGQYNFGRYSLEQVYINFIIKVK